MDVKTKFSYCGEFGLRFTFTAYGHVETRPDGHSYAVLDHVSDDDYYVVGPPVGSPMYVAALDAIDAAARDAYESLHYGWDEGKQA